MDVLNCLDHNIWDVGFTWNWCSGSSIKHANNNKLRKGTECKDISLLKFLTDSFMMVVVDYEAVNLVLFQRV